MRLKSLTCPCGEKSSDFIYSPNVGETMARSGFGFVLDVSNGMDTLWLCPACARRVHAAWQEIVRVTGSEFVHVTKTGCEVSP